MSKLLKVLLGLGLFVYFIVLVVVATPATLVTANLAKAVPQLQLSIISGTAWKGRAADAAVVVQGKALSLGALKWEFKPLSLMALKACVDLESDIFSGNVCRTITGQNQFHRVQADLPAALANRFIKEAEFAGVASLNIVRGEVSDKGEVAKLSGNFSWRSARVKVQGMWFTLGDYAADLVEAGDGNINASIFDLSGPFGLKLNTSVGVGIQTPKISGEVTPREGDPVAITDNLSLFPEKNGTYTVTF